MTPLQPRKEIRKLKAIGFFSVSACLRMSGKALHSELELECSKRNSSRNEFFAIFEVRHCLEPYCLTLGVYLLWKMRELLPARFWGDLKTTCPTTTTTPTTSTRFRQQGLCSVLLFQTWKFTTMAATLLNLILPYRTP